VGRARIVPVALVLVGGLTLAAVAQGGGGTSPNFTRADLPGLVFKPSDAPPGMRYVRGPEGSGPRFLEREAEPGDEISRLVQQLRRRGFLISFGVQFFARHERAKIGFLEAIAFLFRNEDSERRGFNFLERAVPGRFESPREIPAPGLGEASFGSRGSCGENCKGFEYGWRIGDVVQLLTLVPLHGRQLRPSAQAAARRFANQLEALATEQQPQPPAAQPPSPQPPPAPY
jgi:hypothetical protein